MNHNARNKRILLLGGNHLMTSLVEECQEIGLEVYLTDNIKDSPAKKICDHAFNISIRDIEAILDLIQDYQIDGVLCGFTDSILPYYQEICQRAEVPCYITNERQISVTTDKSILKKALKSHTIPFLDSYDAQEISTKHFPVIIKPTDNSGGRGIQICSNIHDLKKSIEVAKEYSKSNQVIIEEMLDAPEATVFYFIKEGKINYLGISDRLTGQIYNDSIQLPTLYRFPSNYQANYISQLDSKVRALIENLEMSNGLVYLQMFYHNRKFIVYELAYRLTGSLEYKIFEKTLGYNPAKELAAFAVGKKTRNIEPSRDAAMCGYNLTISCDDYRDISSVTGLEDIIKFKSVIYVHQNFTLGGNDGKAEKGTLAQVIYRILFLANSEEEARNIISMIKKALRLHSKSGNDIPYYTA